MKLMDIHCHILPMVDDGAESLETSVEILKEARRQGVTHMIVTPHYRQELFEPTLKRVLISYRKMKPIANEMGIHLGLGCEYYRNENMIRDLQQKLRPTLAGSVYVLVEFSMQDTFSMIRNYVYELTTHGYKPIIAHLERYFCCQKLERVLELREMGAGIQLNADSVLGECGWRTKKFCFMLMKSDAVDYIASDTHDLYERKINLKKCAGYVSRRMGKQYAARIFWDNPRKIWESRCRS